MILLAGGTGTIGTRLLPLLTARAPMFGFSPGTRNGPLILRGESVQVVEGDVTDGAGLATAMAGMQTVISAIHGFDGSGPYNPQTVDAGGNGKLIASARQAGVSHFILMSISGAAPRHPIELFRSKYEAEQELRSSGLAWTIIRPTAYMETWGRLLGEPLLKTGKTMIFGPGTPEPARGLRGGPLDVSETTRRYPSIVPTRFEDVVRREYPRGNPAVVGTPAVA